MSGKRKLAVRLNATREPVVGWNEVREPALRLRW